MAEVITKFKLETTQFDSKLRDTAKALQDVAKTAQNGGKDFNNFSQKTIEAARALGTIASGATNTKDKLRDLVGSYNDAVKAYDKLSDAAKQGEFGKAMSASLQQLQQRIKETKTELYELGDAAKGGGLFSGDKLSGMLQVFGGNLMTKGFDLAAGAVTSFVSEIGDAVKQGIELAKQGEGIRIAFERLGRGDILDGLRKATHGTVTDIELMKAAVKFNDFKLPIEELGTMLAFAQQKAKDTGQSVDYMVDSIVTGLGRKSLMILDNLGLSAAEIKDRMKETGDMTKAVGAIIRDQMAAAGDYVETAADRAAQANVSLQNKMEELGRKFGPVEEASNQLWTSMKIRILDIIGGPLAQLLNGLTEAGRLKNALNDINGDGSSGNTVVGGKLKQLQAAKNSGASQYMLNTMQSGTIEGWNRQIMKADELLKQFEKNHSSVNIVLQNATKQFGQKFSSISELEAWRDAYKVMVSDYRKGASEIMKPVKVNIQTDNAIKSVDELKVKLAELQAQRKKVAAGSDEAKRLDTEIRQVKADIKAQNPNALKTTTTHKTTPQEKASEMVATAERTYAETLQKAALRMEAGLDTTLQGKKNELSAQERLFDAYNDAYATYKDPKYKEAANDAANKIKSLAGEVTQMEDAVKASKVKWEQGASGFNSVTMGEWMKGRQSDLSKAEYGSADYSNIMSNIADMNAIKTVLEQSMKAGIDAAKFDLEPLWEKVFDGENIPDSTWQGMVDTINEKLKELGIEPIQINFKTGNIEKDGKKTEKAWSAAADAVRNVGSAFAEIEDPGVKAMGTVMQAIANIALGFAQASAQSNTAGTGWGWLAWLAAGTAAMATTISTIHSLTGYAEGGIIKGNTYSGDMIPANGGTIGLNAGEVVLNRAQSGVLASQLEGSAGGFRNGQIVGRIEGENIVLVVNRFFRRTGQGEILTWRN